MYNEDIKNILLKIPYDEIMGIMVTFSLIGALVVVLI